MFRARKRFGKGSLRTRTEGPQASIRQREEGLYPNGSVVLTECGSVGFCAVGAAVMVYPDGVWYAQVRAADVPEIVEQHILKGRIVERLALLRVAAPGGASEASG